MEATMKRYFFCYNKDLTEDENGEKFKPFINKKLSEEMNQELVLLNEDYQKLTKANSPYLSMIRTFLFSIPTVILICSLFSVSEKGWKVMFENSKWFLLVALIILIFAIALQVSIMIRKKKASTSEVAKTIEERTQKYIDKKNDYFEIPSDYVLPDVLINLLKMKRIKQEDGEVITEEVLANQNGIVSNACITLYRRLDKLCICDNTFEYTFPIEAIESFMTIPYSFSFLNWNKKEAYNSPKYKPYQIRFNGTVFYAKKVARMVFTYEENQYVIDFLPCEYEDVLRILGPDYKGKRNE